MTQVFECFQLIKKNEGRFYLPKLKAIILFFFFVFWEGQIMFTRHVISFIFSTKTCWAEGEVLIGRRTARLEQQRIYILLLGLGWNLKMRQTHPCHVASRDQDLIKKKALLQLSWLIFLHCTGPAFWFLVSIGLRNVHFVHRRLSWNQWNYRESTIKYKSEKLMPSLYFSLYKNN